MDSIFQFCVDVLRWLATFIGVSYEAINVWLFVVIQPLVTLYFFFQYKKYKMKLYESKSK